MTPRGAHSYRFGPFLLVTAERVLLCQGQRVPLTPKVFETLLTLVENAGHTVLKETLFKRVWPDTVVQEDSLTFTISTLRKILASHGSGNVAPTFRSAPAGLKPGATTEAPNGLEFIHTEHKLGYRFVAPVTILPPDSAEPEAGAEGDHRFKIQNSRHDGIGIGPGAGTASSNGREAVGGAGFSVRRAVVWGTAGLGLLIVVATTVWLATPPPEPKIQKYDQLTSDGREKGAGVATDGARVYFIEEASTGWVIAQVSASGGEPIPITSTPDNSEITDISRDHRDLLVVDGREFGPGAVEVVPVLGGEPRRLGNIRAYSAAWSPDGATLAYTTDGGVYLCDPDGSNSRQIVAMSGQLIELRWSPKGRKLCFTRSEHSQDSLWEVERDGSGLTCLSPGLLPALASSISFWTPNGEYLISQSSCAGHTMPSAVRLSSGPLRRHSGQPICLGLGPLDLGASTISPDGDRLFGLGRASKLPQMEEYDRRDREYRPFLPNISADYADFSKDGRRIAFVTGDKEITGASCLWISQIDGIKKVQITKPPLLAQLPRWSPDGKWVAFMGKDPGQPWRVRVVSVDGGSYAPVTAVNDQEGAPTWSPDSTQIAFGGMIQPPERTTGQLVIHMLNLKTRQLTNLPGSEDLWTARWSPDGRYLAALTKDSRNLMLFDFRTARWVKLATLAQIPDIVWSRHEAALYFNGEPTAGDTFVFRLKIPGGQVERLASLKGRTESGWLGLTPDDSPLIARHLAAQEIYALTVNWP